MLNTPLIKPCDIRDGLGSWQRKEKSKKKKRGRDTQKSLGVIQHFIQEHFFSSKQKLSQCFEVHLDMLHMPIYKSYIGQ